MSIKFFEELQIAFKTIEKIKSEHDIRVVIITGRGRHFTAGLDLKDAGSITVN